MGKVKNLREDEQEGVRAKILHTLSIYPRLQPSMLHVGIGLHTEASLWRPVLDEMVEAGEVISSTEQHTSPAGRLNQYTILSLAKETNKVVK